MKAITLAQPWAWAVVHSRVNVPKKVWRPPRKVLGETIAIHAGPALSAETLWAMRQGIYGPDLMACPPRTKLAGRAIIATATVVAGATSDGGDWHFEDVWPVRWPIPCSGKQGLWTLPPLVLEAVLKQGRQW